MKISGIITSLKKKLTDFGSGVNNFAGNVIRQAPAMLQNYSNTYQKVSPFIPFAPQMGNPQKINNSLNFAKRAGQSFYNSSFKPLVTASAQELYHPSQNIGGFAKKMTIPIINAAVSTYGLAKAPISAGIGGLINVGFNKLSKSKQASSEAFGGGAAFASKLNAISAPIESIPAFQKLGQSVANKIPIKKIASRVGNVASSVAKEFTKGAVYSGMEGQNPIKGGLSFAPYGLIAGFNPEAGKIRVKGTHEGPLQGGDIKAVGEMYNRATSNWMEKGKVNLEQFQKDISLAETILKDKYGMSVKDIKKLPLKNKFSTLFDIAKEDYRQNPGITMGLVDKDAQKLTPEQLVAKKRLPGILLTTSKKKAGRDFNIKDEDAFIKGLEQDKLDMSSGKYKPQIDSNVNKIPDMTKFDQDQMINKAKFKSTEEKQAFDNLFAEWIGKRNASKTIGVQTGAKLNVPQNINGEEVIKFMENPHAKVSNEAKQYSGKLRTEFDSLYDYANKSGIDIGYLKDYITHIWDRPQEEVAQLYKTLGQKFNFSKERKYPTYEEGIKMGLKPKFTNPAQLLSEYTKKLEKTKANIEFANQLKDQGFLSTLKAPGLVPITAEGFTAPRTRMFDGGYREGAYYAPPEVAKVINQVFSKQESGMSIPAKISSGIQDVTLSGGIPKTPINAWTFAQVTKEVMAGRVKGPLKAIWTSLSDTGANKYFSENAELIKEQQLNNIPISTTFNTESLVKKGTIEGLFGKDIGEAWNKTVNEPTFKRFMPVLQTEFYKDAKNAAISAGKSSEEAIQVASQATKNFYGLTSTAKTAQQGQLGKDVLSTFAFAPRYRESMINFWLNNIKSLANPLALENRSNLKFMIGATLTALAYDKLNRFYNNGRSILDNPKGKEDKLLIPLEDGTVIGVPYLSSIATMPRAIVREGKMVLQGDISGAIKDAAQTYSSSMIRPLADVAANSDYFGKPITEDNMTTGEKFGAIGKYLGTQYLSHPYLRELLDPRNQKDPAYQRLSRAMEAPFRFYTNKSIESGYYYDAKDNAVKGLGDQEQQAFNAIPKSDSNNPNTRILKYQIYLTYPKVFEAKQQIELQTAQRTGKAIDPLYLVNYDTAKKYMRYEALPEGSQDRKDMTKAYPELIALFDIRSKYFNENPIPGTVQSSNKPIASSYVQQQMDAKNWKDPQVQAYLNANTQYNNQQREKLGLPPLAGYVKFAKKPKAKKLAFKKIKVKKPKKMAKLKIKMPKNTIKITKIKIKQPKKITFKIRSIVSDLKKLS